MKSSSEYTENVVMDSQQGEVLQLQVTKGLGLVGLLWTGQWTSGCHERWQESFL